MPPGAGAAGEGRGREPATCCAPGTQSLGAPKIGRGGAEDAPELGEERGDRPQEEAEATSARGEAPRGPRGLRRVAARGSLAGCGAAAAGKEWVRDGGIGLGF